MNSNIDARLDKIDESHGQLHNLISEIEDILETLITNDTALLDALSQMLSAVPQMQARNERSQAKLAEEIRNELRAVLLKIEQTSGERKSAEKATLSESDDFLKSNPDIALLQYLYSFLPDPVALDIGANVGNVSERLLQAGYEVYAFEPNPGIYPALQEKLAGRAGFKSAAYALGSAEGTMSLNVVTGNDKYGDPSLFSSLVEHPMPEDLPFTKQVSVPVRTIAGLARNGEIPAKAGIIKIDTEGYDLEVIRGLGGYPSPVIMSEFWDAHHAFGRTGKGRLEDTVTELRKLGYRWYIVMYHVDAAPVSYYCNRPQTVFNSWGNAIFFNEHSLFLRAHSWCETALAATLHK